MKIPFEIRPGRMSGGVLVIEGQEFAFNGETDFGDRYVYEVIARAYVADKSLISGKAIITIEGTR